MDAMPKNFLAFYEYKVSKGRGYSSLMFPQISKLYKRTAILHQPENPSDIEGWVVRTYGDSFVLCDSFDEVVQEYKRIYSMTYDEVREETFTRFGFKTYDEYNKARYSEWCRQRDEALKAP